MPHALAEQDPPTLALRLLGRMQASAGGRDVLPRSRKARAMLAVLALSGPEPVLRDTLMGLLWSRRELIQARASFRQTLHELQTALAPAGAVLQAGRGVVALRAADFACDALALLAGSPDPPAGVFGEDLGGLDPAFDRWLDHQRQRIDRAAVNAAEAALQASPGPAAAAQAARRLLALRPDHEGATGALMQALDLLGRRGEALTAYDRCAAALSDRSGLYPSAATVALRDRLLAAGQPPAAHPPAHAPVPDQPVPDPPPAGPSPAHPPPVPGARRKAGIRLGVLPFRSLDADCAGLSIGLAEEITTALASFRWIFLIASPSVAALAHEPRATSANWRALDLDFLLDGTIQRGPGRIRVNARLLDLRGAEELVWAHRFDRDDTDLLTLQDEIAAETVARIDPELLLREGSRSHRQAPGSATAYDLLLRAIPALYRIEEQEFRAAGHALAEAAALDPGYGAVQAWWAFWHVFLVGQGWAPDPVAAMTRAGELAERAVALDPADARALTIAGHVQAFMHRRLPQARALHERALSLNPNLPLAWTFAGLAHAYGRDHQQAIRMISHALALSPFDPHGFFFENSLMLPLLLTGRHEQVVQHASRAITLHPRLSSTYKGLLAALGHLGRTKEAQDIRERLLALEPGFCRAQAAARSPMHPDDVGLYVEGLRLAGLA